MGACAGSKPSDNATKAGTRVPEPSGQISTGNKPYQSRYNDPTNPKTTDLFTSSNRYNQPLIPQVPVPRQFDAEQQNKPPSKFSHGASEQQLNQSRKEFAVSQGNNPSQLRREVEDKHMSWQPKKDSQLVPNSAVKENPVEKPASPTNPIKSEPFSFEQSMGPMASQVVQAKQDSIKGDSSRKRQARPNLDWAKNVSSQNFDFEHQPVSIPKMQLRIL